MRRLFVLVAVTAIVSPAQANDCTTLENPSERLACYDAGSPSTVATTSTATVSGTVTWQYNDYVGSKGDVGAKVYLVPHPLNENLEKLKAEADLHLDGALSIYGSRIGGYKAKADGYGMFSISGVQDGTYDVLIISKKTRTYPNSEYNAFCRSKYESYGSGSTFEFKKVSCKSITVRDGLNIMHNHDFGYTER